MIFKTTSAWSESFLNYSKRFFEIILLSFGLALEIWDLFVSHEEKIIVKTYSLSLRVKLGNNLDHWFSKHGS